MTGLRATCSCTSTPLLRAGKVVCATCGSPVVAETTGPTTYGTYALPPDCPNVDAFTRACRSGRVAGAAKSGRTWTCTADAWRSRAPTPAPAYPFKPKPRKTTAKPAPENAPTSTVSDELLAELGLRRRSA